jgi:putative ABC transport system permease protein
MTGIECLGVLGMTLFESNARLKELLTRDNLRLVSAPVIYFMSAQWLVSYPVRITISWTFVVIPFALLAVLVGLVAGLQTIRAASTSPVDHLKDD